MFVDPDEPFNELEECIAIESLTWRVQIGQHGQGRKNEGQASLAT
jgi:hypothetical protein